MRGLIVATSGRFSADAVDWAEKHNDRADLPLIELWPEGKLETLLAERPHVAAAHASADQRPSLDASQLAEVRCCLDNSS
ncbi:MAG TPA: hypothetical protein VK537_04700 [Galbitalea sp.]|nr:hypothetical protein [Galbitalea sp.]